MKDKNVLELVNKFDFDPNPELDPDPELPQKSDPDPK